MLYIFLVIYFRGFRKRGVRGRKCIIRELWVGCSNRVRNYEENGNGNYWIKKEGSKDRENVFLEIKFEMYIYI